LLRPEGREGRGKGKKNPRKGVGLGGRRGRRGKGSKVPNFSKDVKGRGVSSVGPVVFVGT